MLLQVHDELVFELPEKLASEVGQLVKKEMEGAITLAAPLVVDVKTGVTWGNMHPM
jgi:DNA polymerase-1